MGQHSVGVAARQGGFLVYSMLHLQICGFMQEARMVLACRNLACYIVTGVNCVGCQDEVKGALQLFACRLVDVPDLQKGNHSISSVVVHTAFTGITGLFLQRGQMRQQTSCSRRLTQGESASADNLCR